MEWEHIVALATGEDPMAALEAVAVAAPERRGAIQRAKQVVGLLKDIAADGLATEVEAVLLEVA